MSRKYKFQNPSGIYFVSFAAVYWLDVFIREQYFAIVVDSLNFCIEKKGMTLYCWCIMPSHVHLIFAANDGDPSGILRSLKTHTSKELQQAIEENNQESRKEWLLWMMERAGKKNSNIEKRQFWQQHNQPVELWSNEVFDQKLLYIHNNPIEAGFVNNPYDWKYSSAGDYAGMKGPVKVTLAF